MLAHLLWQHWRQSAWLMGLLAGLHFALSVLMMFSGLSSSQDSRGPAHGRLGGAHGLLRLSS